MKRLEALAALAQSIAYIEQVASHGLVVAAIPTHNFGVPSGFKAWMDQIAMPGRTFKYEAGNSVGLLSGKSALVVLAAGGDFRKQGSGIDHAGGHSVAFFEFLGMRSKVVHVHGQAAPGAEIVRAAAAREAQLILDSWGY